MLSRRFLLRFFDLGARHFWLHLIPVIMLTLAGIIFLFMPVYTTHAAIYVQRNTLLGELVSIRIRDDLFNGIQVLTPATLTVTELKELIQTKAFAYAVISRSDVAEELNGTNSQEQRVLQLYREAVSITVEGDNLVLIRVEAETPELTYQFASGTLEAFRSWKVNRDVRDGQIAQSFFEEVQIAYSEELARAQEALRRYLEFYPEPAVGTRPIEEIFEIEQLQTAVKVAENRLRDVIDKAESVRLTLIQSERDVDQIYQIVDQPRLPTAPEPFYYQLPLALIFPVVGVMIAIIMVLGRVAAERSLLNDLDVRVELALPVLAILPAPQAQQQRKTTTRSVSVATSFEEARVGSLPSSLK